MKVCVLLAALLGLWSVNRVPTAEGKLLANSHEQSLFRRLRQENTAWTDNSSHIFSACRYLSAKRTLKHALYTNAVAVVELVILANSLHVCLRILKTERRA